MIHATVIRTRLPAAHLDSQAPALMRVHEDPVSGSGSKKYTDRIQW